MKLEVTRVGISNEIDIVLAHRRAMQMARLGGVSLPEQTRFATAVSEICRNCLEYAREGMIVFYVDNNPDRPAVEAEVTDKGKGIEKLQEILVRDPNVYRGRGLGIVFARRLSDEFEINSRPDGTTVRIRKNIAVKNTLLSRLIIEGWKKHIMEEPALSAYEELKLRNNQLLELTEELRDQKEHIEALNMQLRQRNKNMQEFTYAISHDIRAPLSSLKLSLELLQGDEQSQPIINILNRSVNRLTRTIDGLIGILDMQHADRHALKDIKFSELMSEVEEDQAETLREIKAKVQRDFSKADSLHYVEGYARSILTNLLSNSIKYRSNRPLVITIHSEPSAKGIRLIYKDNGTGIDLSKNANEIFKPFRRFVSGGEGKGIGLYIIKAMVENNGGSVSLESQPDQGVTFTFELIRYMK